VLNGLIENRRLASVSGIGDWVLGIRYWVLGWLMAAKKSCQIETTEYEDDDDKTHGNSSSCSSSSSAVLHLSSDPWPVGCSILRIIRFALCPMLSALCTAAACPAKF
jgi:hypothetical protein